MTWLSSYRDSARETAQSAWRAPIGLMSPLWLAYGAAVSAGTAWWWMNRLARAANLEAMYGSVADAGVSAATIPALAVISEPALEPPPIAATPETDDSKIDAAPPPAAEASESPPLADDLTRMVGIGPRLAEALADRGVTTFAQIAAWTDAEASEVDAALNLKGRPRRDAWVAQARRFAEARD